VLEYEKVYNKRLLNVVSILSNMLLQLLSISLTWVCILSEFFFNIFTKLRVVQLNLCTYVCRDIICVLQTQQMYLIQITICTKLRTVFVSATEHDSSAGYSWRVVSGSELEWQGSLHFHMNIRCLRGIRQFIF